MWEITWFIVILISGVVYYFHPLVVQSIVFHDYQQDTTFCKSILHEYAVKMNIEKPAYTTSQLEGVLLPSFISSLVFDGKTYTGAAGRSKKEAEQIAARVVIQSILAYSDTRTIMSEIVKSKGKLYAAIQKNSDSGLSHLGNVASGQQARNDSSSSTAKGKEIQAAPANDDLAGVANQKQLLLGQLPAATETKSLLEAKKPKEEYPCEQSVGPIGSNTSPPVLAQGDLPSGLKSSVFESFNGSYQAEQNQVSDLAGPSMQSCDAQYGVPSSKRKRSRKKKGGHQHKKARTEQNFTTWFMIFLDLSTMQEHRFYPSLISPTHSLRKLALLPNLSQDNRPKKKMLDVGTGLAMLKARVSEKVECNGKPLQKTNARTLNDGKEIAVKGLSAKSKQGATELKNEMKLTAKLQHRNLVRMLVCCIKRVLKTSNMFWENEMNPKISDFGMAKESETNTNGVVGTFAAGMATVEKAEADRMDPLFGDPYTTDQMHRERVAVCPGKSRGKPCHMYHFSDATQ
ncbi:hypothetical protein COCNU_06G007670 [Cocos nucifera]|uniref:DRBM domain-containing protein n=1 Tax=Cocos nucifera TaxID=13894 RepID=A0A8K0IAW6_COCNU|nr:hypothetical protein COCNU_06G007670 [Cocos nucifera]